MTRVIGRAEWGARFRDGFGSRSISLINSWWLHHSVTYMLSSTATFNQDAAAVRAIEEIGQNRFNGGISYTYLIPPSGRIFAGHSLGRIGAHTAGYNTRGVGICLIGNYETNHPTPAQLAAVVWLLQNVLGNNLSGGHRDTKSTACPGSKAYAQIPSIQAAFNGSSVEVNNPAITTPPPPNWVGSTNTLQLGSTGYKVRRLQELLNEKFPEYSNLVVDGDFGPATEKVVKEFQRRSFITVDGVVGPTTAEKMGLVFVLTPIPDEIAKYEEYDMTSFITEVLIDAYQTEVGREPAESELAPRRLRIALNKSTLVEEINGIDKSVESDRYAVRKIYLEELGRDGSVTEWDHWIKETGNDLDKIRSGIKNSEEYKLRKR